jgi:AcrR family transcriptional regulator
MAYLSQGSAALGVSWMRVADDFNPLWTMQDATNRGEITLGRPSWPTTPEPVWRDEIRRVQREKILWALVELVSRRGYKDTSTERICRRAGVSLPTFRSHFAGKEAAFLAAFDEAVVAGKERVAVAVAAVESDWASKVEAGLSTLLAFVEEDPARARLCLVESLTAGPAGFDRYETTVRLCEPGLSLGRAEVGDGPELPPLLEETIAGGVAWTIHHKVANGEAGHASQLLEQLLETTLRPYLGEAEAMRFVRLVSARG